MVLPSQSGRVSHRRSHMFRKKRLGRMPQVAGVLGVTLVFVWITSGLLFGGDGAGETSPSTEGSLASNNHSSQARSIANDVQAITSDEIVMPSLQGESLPPSRPVEPPPASASNNHTSGTNQLADAGTSSASTTAPRRPVDPEAARRAAQKVNYAIQLIDSAPLKARELLTDAMLTGALADADERKAIAHAEILASKLVFSPLVLDDDPFSMQYTVRSGDSLQEIVKDNGLLVDWRLIKRINEIKNVRRIRVGQSLKLLTGPFHAIVHKSDYRLDLYLGEGANRVYVKSFSVGLGEYNSTPIGRFVITSRLINPEWINPRTRKRYLPDDPSNPIGEFWLGLEGIDPATRDFTGYGVHGTIEPASIGTQASMGCVRLLPKEVEVVWECLVSEASIVEIKP